MSNTVSNAVRNDFNKARIEARNATKRFVVRSLTKKGVISKAPPSALEMAYCASVTREDAEIIMASQQAMNPTLRFIIVAL